ncbi:beta-lactamase-like protein [Hyaloraphidium curvatum]|nr:beta-lactamase-like protein [Hyaloraphidium curvatum]
MASAAAPAAPAPVVVKGPNGDVTLPAGLPLLPDYQQLSPLVHRVLGLNPGTFQLQGTNCYIVGDGDQRALVDTGEGIDGFTELLKDSIKKAGGKIAEVLITHYHHDHVGGIDQILSFTEPAPRFHKFIHPQTDPTPNPVYTPLADKQTISVPGATIVALHTPGHCPDHVAFYLEEEKAIFAGDCVLGHGTTVFQDLKEYVDGLKKLLEREVGRIYPGHGPVVENGKAKLEEYIKHRQEREDQILDVLSKTHAEGNPSAASNSYEPWVVEDMIKIIYAAYPPHLQKAAYPGVMLHLGKLEKEGKAARVDEKGTRWKLTEGTKL